MGALGPNSNSNSSNTIVDLEMIKANNPTKVDKTAPLGRTESPMQQAPQAEPFISPLMKLKELPGFDEAQFADFRVLVASTHPSHALSQAMLFALSGSDLSEDEVYTTYHLLTGYINWPNVCVSVLRNWNNVWDVIAMLSGENLDRDKLDYYRRIAETSFLFCNFYDAYCAAHVANSTLHQSQQLRTNQALYPAQSIDG